VGDEVTSSGARASPPPSGCGSRQERRRGPGRSGSFSSSTSACEPVENARARGSGTWRLRACRAEERGSLTRCASLPARAPAGRPPLLARVSRLPRRAPSAAWPPPVAVRPAAARSSAAAAASPRASRSHPIRPPSRRTSRRALPPPSRPETQRASHERLGRYGLEPHLGFRRARAPGPRASGRGARAARTRERRPRAAPGRSLAGGGFRRRGRARLPEGRPSRSAMSICGISPRGEAAGEAAAAPALAA